MPDLWQTVARFPVPVLICLVATVVLNLDIAGVYPLDLDHMGPYRGEQVYGGLAMAFLASGAGHLFAEGRRWGGLASVALAVAGAVFFAGLCWFLRPLNLQFEFLLPGLILLVMVAGYMRGDRTDNAIWMFNARLALAIVLSALVSVVFGGGLSAITESIQYLFGVDFDSEIHGHIWATGIALVGSVFGLSMVSRDLSEAFDPEQQTGLLVTGTQLLLSYLLVPLAIVYVVILHLYALKTLFEWDLPKGQVGMMVLVFSLGGAAVWLIASPWRQGRSALLRFFTRNWFLFLIVPLCLLAIGTWRRISDYGVTPERYGLAALGLWILFLVAWFAIRSRSIQPRVILASLSLLLIVTSVGPWGAGSVSIASQRARLAAVLEEQGFLQNGKLVIPDTLDAKASGQGYSIVLFLSKHRRLDVLAPIFAGFEDDPFDGGLRRPDAYDVVSVLKFERQQDRPQSDGDVIAVHFQSLGPKTLDIEKSAKIAGVLVYSGHQTEQVEANFADPYLFVKEGDFAIAFGNASWRIKVSDLLDLVEAAPQTGSDIRPLVVTLPGENGDAKMVLLSMNGRRMTDSQQVDYLRAIVILPEQ